MNVSELMIGDLVNDSRITTQFRPCRIVNIDDNRCCVGLYDIDDEDEDMIGIYARHIEPIHLTEKILKANGFKGSKIFGWIYMNDVHDIKITVWLLSGTVEIDTYRDNLVVHPQYVHELQHALRICGLNDIADNFKIPKDN